MNEKPLFAVELEYYKYAFPKAAVHCGLTSDQVEDVINSELGYEVTTNKCHITVVGVRNGIADKFNIKYIGNSVSEVIDLIENSESIKRFYVSGVDEDKVLISIASLDVEDLSSEKGNVEYLCDDCGVRYVELIENLLEAKQKLKYVSYDGTNINLYKDGSYCTYDKTKKSFKCVLVGDNSISVGILKLNPKSSSDINKTKYVCSRVLPKSKIFVSILDESVERLVKCISGGSSGR